MAFNSFEFAAFLALVLATYYCLRKSAQNIFLLIASYVFYGFWDWRFTLLLAFTTTVDYFVAQKIAGNSEPKTRLRWLWVSIAANFSVLGFFKYFNFFADSAAQLLNGFGIEPGWVTLNVILPVGISFYTFQSLSYSIDVYRNQMFPTKKWTDFALYVAFFPQLVAGPIERASHLLPEIQATRLVTRTKLTDGSSLILIGLFKKMVIADNAAPYVNEYFSSPSDFSSPQLLLGAYFFALQIYCDFSAYTDIARGCAKLLGFELMHNFRQPYLSTNITEFWRKWHISLSTWLRDYLYIPLGGNRISTQRTYLNLMTVMLLGGLWHGASWSFVMWGGLHGLYLSIHKFLIERKPFAVDSSQIVRKYPIWRQVLGVIFTFHLVCFAWIFFRANNFALAAEYIGGIASWVSFSDITARPFYDAFKLLMALALPVLAIDMLQSYKKNELFFRDWPWALRGLLYFILLIAITIFTGENEAAFIYFQF